MDDSEDLQLITTIEQNQGISNQQGQQNQAKQAPINQQNQVSGNQESQLPEKALGAEGGRLGDGLVTGEGSGGGGPGGAQLPLRARLLQRLCRRMLPPLCNAMLACTRKRLPTAAAFINTIALPQLFSAQVRQPVGGGGGEEKGEGKGKRGGGWGMRKRLHSSTSSPCHSCSEHR